MAKSKKSESAPANAPKKKIGKIKTGEPAVQPLVDTNLAAESAARRVVAGLSPASAASSPPMPESASFKHLKDSLSKPAGGGLAGMLDKTAGPGQKKSNTPFHGGKTDGPKSNLRRGCEPLRRAEEDRRGMRACGGELDDVQPRTPL